jgi:hypothetical protein
MKTFLAVMIFAASALAQGPSVRAASACGIEDVTFGVKLDKTQRPLAQPESEKAMVYFIQDDGPWGEHQHYVLKIALDGAWVGAYKKNSYFTVQAKPGEHHVCATVQTDDFAESVLALVHFTAEPGKVYYFRTRFLGGTSSLYPSPPYLDLDPLDSDQAKYLIASYPLSVSTAKK